MNTLLPEHSFTETRLPAVPFDMIFVQGGTFQMGGSDPEAYDDEKPIHRVTVPDFFIGKFPVTQALWKAVLNGDDPSRFKGDRRPVEQVSLDDITERFLPELRRLAGKRYRLPTEAEWEYAARGGKYSEGYLFAGSDKLTEVGWFDKNSANQTHEVGQLYPNELGIFDMSGNVWEWVDHLQWQEDYIAASTFHTKRPEKSSGLQCGGSWGYNASDCRVSSRVHRLPWIRVGTIGFRLVCTYPL